MGKPCFKCSLVEHLRFHVTLGQQCMLDRLVFGHLQPAQEPRRRKKQITDAGRGWYNMERSSHDADFKRDVKIIQLRNYLDPKKFYKVC